jgi:periplasmic divalent cation tolerance protein
VANGGDAQRIGRALVERRLAACVNVVPGVTSIYAWKGSINTHEELLLVIKTRREKLDEVRSALLELHPYEVPELIALPIEGGHHAYLEWIEDSVSEGRTSTDGNVHVHVHGDGPGTERDADASGGRGKTMRLRSHDSMSRAGEATYRGCRRSSGFAGLAARVAHWQARSRAARFSSLKTGGAARLRELRRRARRRPTPGRLRDLQPARRPVPHGQGAGPPFDAALRARAASATELSLWWSRTACAPLHDGAA